MYFNDCEDDGIFVGGLVNLYVLMAIEICIYTYYTLYIVLGVVKLSWGGA